MRANLLLIDDDARHCRRLVRLIGARHTTAIVSNARQAVYYATACDVDLVFLGADSSQFDALTVCQTLKQISRCEAAPVLLTTASVASSELVQLTGADDFLLKPVDSSDLDIKLNMHLKLSATRKQLESANNALAMQQNSLRELREHQSRLIAATQDLTIFAMAKLAGSRDPETGDHLHRMRDYAVILARQLQQSGAYQPEIDDQFIFELHRAAPLHDIGKVGIRDGILLKPGKLSVAEFEAMKQHTIIGAETLEQTMKQSPGGEFLQMATPIARHHHEWFDGTGYPDGLSGQQIPLPARIVAVADVYDALTSARCYKKAFPPEEARRIICAESGTHFDPVIVDAFTACYQEFLTRQQQTPQPSQQAHASAADALIHTGSTRSAVAAPKRRGAAGLSKAPVATQPAH